MAAGYLQSEWRVTPKNTSLMDGDSESPDRCLGLRAPSKWRGVIFDPYRLCDRTALGILVLERILRDARVTLPPRA